MQNPFSPSFGKLPEIYLGRENDVRHIVENFENRNSPYQTTLVYGMRGTGKTAFLTDVSREAAKRENWVTVDLVMGTSMVQVLIDTIYVKAKSSLQKFVDSISGVTVSAFALSIDVNRSSADAQYQTLLMKLLEELKKKNIWVLVTIDEVKSSPELREFASVYQLCLRNDYNISLVMAGLPQNVSELQNDDVLTFLLRAARITLAPIDRWLIKNSYAKAFAGNRKIDDAQLIEISRMTQGYAYAFQLLGYYLWEDSADGQKITQDIIEQALVPYKADLFRNAYVKIYQSLTNVERRFATVMAESGEESVPFGTIVNGMNKPKNYVSTYRLRLLDTQVIEAPSHGYLHFTLPFFGEFILENNALTAS